MPKIATIKRTLAAEKRKFGAYDDGRGLRYLPPKYFVQLGDYKGGLTYLKWFAKQFPDDNSFPDFLFDWTIILFKLGMTEDAAKKAFQTFCANTYLFDTFFGRAIVPIDKWEGSNLAAPAFTQYIDYSSKQVQLADFAIWLDNLRETQDFKSRCDEYVDIHRRLKVSDDRELRQLLIMKARQLAATNE